MSEIAEVRSTQKSLEEKFAPLQDLVTKQMEALQAQIQAAGPSKDTIAKVAEEFRTFRELIFGVLKLLRGQMSECSRQIDELATRSRRKALIVQGMPEREDENTSESVLGLINEKLGCNLTTTSIRASHRLGQATADHHRPILVRFASVDIKSSVWRAKTRLKGTKIAIREFLTRERQAIFVQARQHFGMRSVWTQDGVIVIKASDGSRCRITTMGELSPLLAKYPKTQGTSSSGARRDAKEAGENLKTTRR
ncbi:hypothetical protein SFRURICE_003121 [Spodoptera frugiperda]|nr:hypothetical protein SFRURICE_003121 [Spodoptera frugiperda]